MSAKHFKLKPGLAASAMMLVLHCISATAKDAPPVLISSTVPNDIGGGAPNASLRQAAAFAWQEFIALNWPALGSPRDTADTSKFFGQSGAGPLVWETFRNKVEIFPQGPTPHGYKDMPPDYGYDDPPQYNYASPISACDGLPASSTPWVNLDENSQIGLDKIFAGVAHATPTNGEILFLAKANRVEYDYVVKNGWFNSANIPRTATANYVLQNNASAPPGSSQYVSFNYGTIEIKSAWRKLTAAEEANGRFHVNTVRFYKNNASNQICFQDEKWGLLALHIIQKTPSAPYFVFATFGQADNMLTKDGKPVEDVDGKLKHHHDGHPLRPQVISQNARSANPATPTTIQQLTLKGMNCTPESDLYYRNLANLGLPTGDICVRRRIHSIPPEIIEANRAAHKAIADYNKANKLKDSPWNYYKLVNVQHKPINKPVPGVDYTGSDAASYYQANIVVETDYNLQLFSGQFQPASSTSSIPMNLNLITDFHSNGTPFYNVRAAGSQYNMGGCMGCHGNAQLGGSDFSFILGSQTNSPDTVGPKKP